MITMSTFFFFSLKVLVAQLCPTLCDLMDCSPPGSSVHGILQARILEWVAIPSPRYLHNPGTEPWFPALQTDSLSSEPPGEDWIHIETKFPNRQGHIWILQVKQKQKWGVLIPSLSNKSIPGDLGSRFQHVPAGYRESHVEIWNPRTGLGWQTSSWANAGPLPGVVN